MTIRLLHPVGDDQQDAVLVVDERRAQRLLRTGYAVEVKSDVREPSDEERHVRTKSRSRV